MVPDNLTYFGDIYYVLHMVKVLVTSPMRRHTWSMFLSHLYHVLHMVNV